MRRSIVAAGATVNADGAGAVVDVVPRTTVASLVSQPGPLTLGGAGGHDHGRFHRRFHRWRAACMRRRAMRRRRVACCRLRVDPVSLPSYTDVPATLFAPREIQVSDTAPDAAPVFGIGSISQAQIDAGGFDAVTLTAQDAVVFEGDVSLHAGRSIGFVSGLVGDSSAAGKVSVAAPGGEVSPPSSRAMGTVGARLPCRRRPAA